MFMSAWTVNALLLPMPTAMPVPLLGSCKRRHCRIHAAERVHEHRLSDGGQWQAAELAGAPERFELQPSESVAREASLDAPMLREQVCCVQ